MPRLTVALTLALIATLLGMAGRSSLTVVDNFLYDSGLSSREKSAPDDIIILGIDQAFMEGRHAYLAPRDRLAKLVRNVASGKPKAIVVDVWLDSRIDNTPSGVDAQLKAALRFAKSQAVPVFLSDVSLDERDSQEQLGDGLTAHGSVLPYFAQEAKTGNVQFNPDGDGVFRYHAHFMPGTDYLPAQLAILAGADKRSGWSQRYVRVPINYCGPPNTIPKEKAVDFLDPNLALLLKDKLVFIGATYPRSADYMYTPYSAAGKKAMYGVELLAQATQDIRQGLPRRSHESLEAYCWDFLLVLMATFLVAALALRSTVLGVVSGIALVALACFCGLISARDITAFWGFRFHPVSPFLLALPLAASGGIAWRSVIEGRDLRRVRSTFGAYVGAEVLESLGGKMPELGGETRRIAVLFCDIRGYSGLAESMNNDPKALLDELNAHFTPLVAALQKRGAYVDNYVGDLVMALFGAPFSSGSYQSDVRGAVLAALDFVNIVETRNVTRREEGLFPIEVGIGVHCGEAVVGNMGSTDSQNGGKIHYTAIGDVVNVASRIESATRGQNVALLVTREVVEACGEGEGVPPWERIGEVQVKGRAAAVEIYKIAGA